MKTEVVVSREAANSTCALLHEFLAKGGTLKGVTPEAVEEMLNALDVADRIVINSEDEE